jgi:hypothetical protein
MAFLLLESLRAFLKTEGLTRIYTDETDLRTSKNKGQNTGIHHSVQDDNEEPGTAKKLSTTVSEEFIGVGCSGGREGSWRVTLRLASLARRVSSDSEAKNMSGLQPLVLIRGDYLGLCPRLG